MEYANEQAPKKICREISILFMTRKDRLDNILNDVDKTEDRLNFVWSNCEVISIATLMIIKETIRSPLWRLRMETNDGYNAATHKIAELSAQDFAECVLKYDMEFPYMPKNDSTWSAVKLTFGANDEIGNALLKIAPLTWEIKLEVEWISTEGMTKSTFPNQK